MFKFYSPMIFRVEFTMDDDDIEREVNPRIICDIDLDNVSLSVFGDYGDARAGFSSLATKKTFLQFLSGMPKDFLMKKLFGEPIYVNVEETINNIRTSMCSQREDGTLEQDEEDMLQKLAQDDDYGLVGKNICEATSILDALYVASNINSKIVPAYSDKQKKIGELWEAKVRPFISATYYNGLLTDKS